MNDKGGAGHTSVRSRAISQANHKRAIKRKGHVFFWLLSVMAIPEIGSSDKLVAVNLRHWFLSVKARPTQLCRARLSVTTSLEELRDEILWDFLTPCVFS